MNAQRNNPWRQLFIDLLKALGFVAASMIGIALLCFAGMVTVTLIFPPTDSIQ